MMVRDRPCSSVHEPRLLLRLGRRFRSPVEGVRVPIFFEKVADIVKSKVTIGFFLLPRGPLLFFSSSRPKTIPFTARSCPTAKFNGYVKCREKAPPKSIYF